MPPTNVATDPLIAVRSHGVATQVGLIELLTRAHELTSLSGYVAPTESAMLRLLITLAARVTGLDTARLSAQSWNQRRNQVLERGSFDPNLITEYFDRYPDRFDLFHPRRPFLQDPRLLQECPSTTGINRLVPYRPTGNTQPWMCHTRPQDNVPITVPEALGWLVMQHQYAPAGGGTPRRRPESYMRALGETTRERKLHEKIRVATEAIALYPKAMAEALERVGSARGPLAGAHVALQHKLDNLQCAAALVAIDPPAEEKALFAEDPMPWAEDAAAALRQALTDAWDVYAQSPEPQPPDPEPGSDQPTDPKVKAKAESAARAAERRATRLLDAVDAAADTLEQVIDVSDCEDQPSVQELSELLTAYRDARNNYTLARADAAQVVKDHARHQRDHTKAKEALGSVGDVDALWHYLKAGPLRGTSSIFLHGRTLFETLVINIPDPTLTAAPDARDVAPWEAENLPELVTAPRVSWPAGLLVGRSRHAILLVPNTEHTEVVDCYLTWAHLEEPEPACDPYLVHLIPDTSKRPDAEPTPVLALSARPAWRDLDAILGPRHGKLVTTPPSIIEQTAGLPEHLLPHIGLRVLSFEQDRQTRDSQWFAASTPPVLIWARSQDPDAARRANDLAAAADLVGWTVRTTLVNAWEQVYQEAPKRSKQKTCVWADEALAKYWPAAENLFWQHMHAGTVPQPVAAAPFATAARRAVRAAIDRWADKPRVVEAIAKVDRIIAATGRPPTENPAKPQKTKEAAAR